VSPRRARKVARGAIRVIYLSQDSRRSQNSYISRRPTTASRYSNDAGIWHLDITQEDSHTSEPPASLGRLRIPSASRCSLLDWAIRDRVIGLFRLQESVFARIYCSCVFVYRPWIVASTTRTQPGRRTRCMLSGFHPAMDS
jgi:hypothetical protein